MRRDCAVHSVDVVETAGAGFVLPVSTVLVTTGTGERAVASRNSAGTATWSVPGPEALAELLDGVAAVLVDGHHLPVAAAVAAAARRRGIPVIADAGSWKPGLEGLLAHVDVLVASADFSVPSRDGTAPLESLLALGPTWVARSAGRDPVHWLSADGASGTVPVPEVEVVDTLGAGDVLHGALLAAVARSRGRRSPSGPGRGGRDGVPVGRGSRRARLGQRQRTPRGLNCTEIRGPTGLVVFGTQWSQVRWQEPPMTTRSPCPAGTRIEEPPPRGAEHEVPRRTHRHDGDHRVEVPRATDAVAVPRDGVPAVAVEAQPGGAERLAELVGVVSRQGVACLGRERRGGARPPRRRT